VGCQRAALFLRQSDDKRSFPVFAITAITEIHKCLINWKLQQKIQW